MLIEFSHDELYVKMLRLELMHMPFVSIYM